MGEARAAMIGRMEGAADAFEAFYRDAWRDAVRWATALTGDRAAGEDVAQSSFGAMAGRFEHLANPAGYLRRAIVNTARSEHRTAARRSSREVRAMPPASTSGPFDHTTGLLQAVGRLPYDQRAALVLRFWADWDEDAIAHALGCRPTTVRSHVKRALDTLRTLDPETLR